MVGSTILVFLTIYIAFLFDLTETVALTILVFYVTTPIYYSWRTISSFRNAHFLMRKFILLDENATLQYATDLHSELVDKGLM